MLSIDEIIDEVNTNLEDIARSVVSKEIDKETDSLIHQYKQQFFAELDSPEQHQPNWHQWGIITHTRNFMKMYDNEVKQYLKAWNRLEAIEDIFRNKSTVFPKLSSFILVSYCMILESFKKTIVKS